MIDRGDELLSFSDEPAATSGQGNQSAPPGNAPAWSVLVVDDAPDVHASTKLALRGLLTPTEN